MTYQTSVALRRLANLDCALEDYQAFQEADDPTHAQISAEHIRDNLAGIREALDKIEAQIA